MDNTVLVLQSDHLSPPSTVSDRLAKYERRNFFSISGPGIAPQTQSKLASMPDVFPTILEALDIAVADGRAGLGTSLFGDRRTLPDVMGEEAFNAAILADTKLGARAWETEPSQKSAQR